MEASVERLRQRVEEILADSLTPPGIVRCARIPCRSVSIEPGVEADPNPAR